MNFSDFFNDTEHPKFLKAGIYGPAGSGKSRTAFEIASGLIKDKGLVSEVVFFDTERGSDYLHKLFDGAGIKLHVRKSRSFRELMEACKLTAGSSVQVMIVDSISHVWRELTSAFLKQYNEDKRKKHIEKYHNDKFFHPSHQLEFQHWGIIKPMWARFTDFFLNSSLHMIVCGRMGEVYKYETNENGRKELQNIGTKMATEKELSYEPSLLIELIPEYINGERQLFGYIEKDRSDTINGQKFYLTKYEHIKPHVDFLEIGGNINTEMVDNTSADLFAGKTLEPEDEFGAEKRKRTIKFEEIKGLLTMKVPGQSAEAKQKRNELLDAVFGTLSETAIEGMHSENLDAGLRKLRLILAEE